MIFKNQLNIKYWIALDIIIVSILIIELVLGLISIPHDIVDHRYGMKINEESNERQIMSIQEKKDSEECEPDTQLLVFDIWPGILEGCECPDLNPSILRHKCTNGLLEMGCKRINKIPHKSITKWRNKELCVKYKNEMNSPKELYIRDFYFNKCGITYQFLRPHFWTKSNDDECPVNDIVINDELHHYNHQGILYQSILLTSADNPSPVYLHWTTKATYNYLISSFLIADEKICSNPLSRNNKSPYILDPYYNDNTCNNTFNVNKPAYSTLHVLIDYIKKGNLFADNGITIPSHLNYPQENEAFLYMKIINETIHEFGISSYKNIDGRLIWQFHIVGVALTLLIQLLLIGYKVIYKYHITICFNWFEMGMMICHAFNFIVAFISMGNNKQLPWDQRWGYVTSNEENTYERYRYSIGNIVLSSICVLMYPSDVVVNCLFAYRKEVLEEEERILQEKKKKD